MLTYFLICSVALVWSVILYRIFFKNSEEDYSLKSVSVIDKQEFYDQYVTKEDTFKLALNYRDPFLGTMEPLLASSLSIPVTKQQNFVPATPASPNIDWNAIKYAGYIVNPISKKLVSIIVVNGKERMLALGERFEGAQLLKYEKDSVLISWKGKQKYIKQ